MTSMNVPEPVMSLAIMPASREAAGNFSKALSRFQREDPTFRVTPFSPQGYPLLSCHRSRALKPQLASSQAFFKALQSGAALYKVAAELRGMVQANLSM